MLRVQSHASISCEAMHKPTFAAQLVGNDYEPHLWGVQLHQPLLCGPMAGHFVPAVAAGSIRTGCPFGLLAAFLAGATQTDADGRHVLLHARRCEIQALQMNPAPQQMNEMSFSTLAFQVV